DDEGVALLEHERLALVHRPHHAQLGDAAVADLSLEERVGDDAQDFSPRLEGRVGHAPHEPHLAAAVDETQAAPRQLAAEVGDRLAEGRIAPRHGSAEHTDASNGHLSLSVRCRAPSTSGLAGSKAAAAVAGEGA